jgi:type I site-specific restriction endonuclease
LLQLKPDEFQLIIIDEAHHVMAHSYNKLLKYFDGARIQVGLTATFRRGDGESILSEEYFSTLLVWHTVAQLTEDGYLAPARGAFVYTQTDLNSVKRSENGDFDERALARVVDTPERNNLVVEAWRKKAYDVPGGRSTVCFCASIAHAQHIAAEFNAKGVPAAAVWGAQDKNEQKEIFDKYRAGEIKVLTNAILLIEGWDEPVTSCVILARPATKASSFVLGPQMIGRGLRLYQGKKDAIIIELRDQTTEGDTSLLAAALEMNEKEITPDKPLHLQKQASDRRAAAEEIEYLAGQIGEVDFASELFDVIEKIEKASRMAWLPLGSRLYMSLSGKDFLEIVEEQSGRFALNVVENGRLKTLKITPTRERAMQLGESWTIANGRDHTLVRRDAEWRTKPATGAAISRAANLTGREKSTLKGMTRGELSDLINAAAALKSQAETGRENRVATYG